MKKLLDLINSLPESTENFDNSKITKEHHKLRSHEKCYFCGEIVNSGNLIISKDKDKKIFISYMALHSLEHHKSLVYLGSENKGILFSGYIKRFIKNLD